MGKELDFIDIKIETSNGKKFQFKLLLDEYFKKLEPKFLNYQKKQYFYKMNPNFQKSNY